MVSATATNGAPVFFFMLAVVPLARAVCFDFFSFDRDTKLTCSPGGEGICLQGDAFLNRGLQLTKNQLDGPITSSVGRAVYSEPVHIWDAASRRAADFTTRFSFLVHEVDPGNQSGDGLAFFLSPYPSSIPDKSSGGFLGLFPNSSLAGAGRNKVVAVEFDTYRNREWDSTSGDHIGINVDSIQSTTEFALEGGIKKKAIAHVWISYNASSKILGVSLYYGEEPPSNQGSFNLSHVVDVTELLPEKVAIGFSAATGLWVETHSILSWSFQSALDEAGYLWLMEILLLMAAVLMGGVGLARLFICTRRPEAGNIEWAKVQEREGREWMEEKGGTEEDPLIADAGLTEETASRRSGKLDIDVDANSINREARQRDSSLNTAETVAEEARNDDLYSPLLMEENGGWEEDCFTVDAEPVEETRSRRSGKLDIDVDATYINREAGQRDSGLNTPEMVAGEVRDEDSCPPLSMEQKEGREEDFFVVDAESMEETASPRSGKLDIDVQANSIETGRRDSTLNTAEMVAGKAGDIEIDSSLDAGAAGWDEQREETYARVDDEPVGKDKTINLDLVHNMANPSAMVDNIDGFISQGAKHMDSGGSRSGRIPENTIEDAEPAMETVKEDTDTISSDIVHLREGKTESGISTDAEPAMGRVADKDDWESSSKSVQNMISTDAEPATNIHYILSGEDICSNSADGEHGDGGQTAEEDISLHESTEDEDIRSRVEMEKGEQSTNKVLAFLEKWSPEEIPYQALATATDNFSEERMLGRGGFGAVYKGFLCDWGIDVAIKKLSDESIQGIKEYVSEVKIISQLRHRNLVKLVGWCHQHGQFLLVYEFMSNGSLDHHLFDVKTQLSWPTRYNIVLGLANALLYLHEECERYVVHRDVKTSNVLLDEKFDAKLGDFGLARLFNHDISSLEVTQLAGTRGYMAPEYALMGKASKGSDVYSFGVVMLEVACGLRSVQVTKTEGDEGGSSAMLLVEGVWELYGKGAILEAADRKLCGDFDRERMERLLVVGLWCAHPDLNQRPSISQARLALLHSDTVPLPDLPSKMPPWAYPLAPGPTETQQQIDESPPVPRASSKKRSGRSLFTRFVWWWKNRKTRNPRKITDDEIRMETDEIRMGTALREFSYSDLHRATGGFAADKQISESDYWMMYRGTLMSGQDVAVKQFLQPQGQGKQWYIGEMMTLSHLSHKNLVKLIGWCHEVDKFLLIEEYMANGNLDNHLFGRGGNRTIPWDVRYKVAIGVASALCYLHDWGLCVLHRDIKSENVMLDEHFNAKLGGFELSRAVDHDLSSMATTQVAGTMGYMAPEYALSGTYTKESDVYSFGVVALEIASGRKIIDLRLPRQEQHLVQWVKKCSSQRRLLEAADPKLQGIYNRKEMERLMRVGLLCTEYEPSLRPTMATVLRSLQFKQDTPK